MFAIPNWLLLAYVGVLASVQVILIIIWATVIPTTLSYIPVPRESFVVHQCHSGDNWTVIAGVEYTFLILLFVFCAVFAWRVRKIPLSEYKEAKEIGTAPIRRIMLSFLTPRFPGYAVYNIGFVAVIAIPLSNVFWYDPTAKVAVIAAATCFSSTVSISCLFVTKFFAIVADLESSASSNKSRTTGSTALTRPKTRSGTVSRTSTKAMKDSRSSKSARDDTVREPEENLMPGAEELSSVSSSSSSSSTSPSAPSS